MEDKTLEQMLLEAAQAKQAKELEAQKSASITKQDLAELFLQFESKVEQRIQKAKEEIEAVRGEGVGRKGTITDKRDEDPVSYLAEKARKPEDLTIEDRLLIGEITNKALISLFPTNINHNL